MRRRDLQGSVVLVALSCVTVLGIALASFLAMSNQAMKLSNRTYAQSVSRQLAQMGLERALRSFHDDTFDVTYPAEEWSRSGGVATKQFTIPSSRYGNSGITATVNIRVEHYRTTKKAVQWSPAYAYAVGDFVWYEGIWYQCITAAPALTGTFNNSYWKAAPAQWSVLPTYQIGNVVVLNGTSYRCIKANQNTTPPNTTYWTAGGAAAAWNASTSYAVDSVVYSGGVPYRCLVANTNRATTNTTYWLGGPVIYAEGVAVLPDSGSTTLKTQLRAIVSPAALFPNAIAATTYANMCSTGTVDSYNASMASYGYTGSPFSTSSPNISSSAVIAGTRTSGNAVHIRNMRVNGYVAVPSATTSPYAPKYGSSTSGIVTSTPAPTVPATKIDVSRISRSPYIPQFEIQSVAAISPAVTMNYLANPSGLVELPRAGDSPNVADGKYYYYTSGSLDVGTGDILRIKRPVVIDIRPSSSADLVVSGTGYIEVVYTTTPPVLDASLEIHFGDRLAVSGSEGIKNPSGDPKRCVLLGTSTSDYSGYHDFSTTYDFIGVIYMPDAYLHTQNSVKILGAISASNVYFEDSGVNVHYDVNLRTAVIPGVDTAYEITDWRELTDPTERITLP